MDATQKAVDFLLETLIKHGDTPTAEKARHVREQMKKELEPMEEVLAFLPHEGTQSPQEKTEEGLGGTDENKAPEVEPPASTQVVEEPIVSLHEE